MAGCSWASSGRPAAGKSTLAAALVDGADRRHGPGTAIVLPMDGFHLANEVLEALGRRQRKGAPDTFDAAGFAALVERVARRDEPVVYAPRFDRSREEAIAGAIAIDACRAAASCSRATTCCSPTATGRGSAPAWTRAGTSTRRSTCASSACWRARPRPTAAREAPATGSAQVDQPNAALVAATGERRADSPIRVDAMTTGRRVASARA